MRSNRHNPALPRLTASSGNRPPPMAGRHPSRRFRKAGRLKEHDYVHDGLVPMTILTIETAPPNSVRVVGRLASGVLITAVHPADRILDVTRMIPTHPIRARGYLTLITETRA